MFLVSSAASLHGHEFSPPVENNAIPRRNTLARSAFSTPTLPRRNTHYDTSFSNIQPRPPRPLSEYSVRESEPAVHFQEPEPEADTMSLDGKSLANSEGSASTLDGRRKRRRSLRTSTSFQLAHPAPTLTQKQRLLQIRPRLLLQLQRLSAESRPRPAIDVVPSTVVVPRLIKKFPRMFRGKGELGANDVMVVKSEDYDRRDGNTIDGTESDEEGLSNRDLMAVICALRKDSGGSCGKAEIVLSNGSVWEASPVTNNLYEFVHVDETGTKTTARWVKRNTKGKSMDFSEAPNTANLGFRFTFSIINPQSRRHPIMASLTPSKLDIPDHYVSVSSSSAKMPPASSTKHFNGEDESSAAEDEPPMERTTHTVDDDLKILIQVTGIWVALRQGLSPYFKYSDTVTCATPTTNSRARLGGRMRSLSLTPETFQSTPAMSFHSIPESGSSLGDKFRRCARGSPASGLSSQNDGDGPKRTVSTGTAFMQRAALRKLNGNTQSTVTSDDEGEGSFAPPKRAATEGFILSKSTFSTPDGSLKLASSNATTLETPTKSKRRIQSAYIPTSTLQHSFMGVQAQKRHSMGFGEEVKLPIPVTKPKIGKWKTFTNFFRRSRGHSSEVA